MSRMSCRQIALLAAVALSGWSAAGVDPAVLDTIALEGRDRSQVVSILESLTRKNGPRLTGSPGLERASKWVMSRFRSWGLENVHLEKWGEIPVGFDRGPRQSAKMLMPYPKDLVFTTNCWTVGTSGPVRGVAVLEPTTQEEFDKVKGQLKGAWLIMRTQVGMRGPILKELKPFDLAADQAGIAGRVYGTGGPYVWTHGFWGEYSDENRPKTPMVVVRKQDYDSFVYNLERSRPVVLEFDIENRFIRRPFELANVIGEIRGTEKPDEVVVVSGHLDSWNGPGSEGTCDNGTGSAVTIEAARILTTLGLKPKRTIRFVLWTGEEQGLHGSRFHVEARRKDGTLDKISAMLNEDAGTAYHGGINALESMRTFFQPGIDAMNKAFPDLPMEFRTVEQLSMGGSDHNSFLAAGVPGFQWMKKGEASYLHVWHTQNDRFEEGKASYLVQMATNTAAAAYAIAMADGLMPRITAGQGRSRGSRGAVGDDHDHDH